MREIIQLIRIWDDLHKKDGRETEAEVTGIVLQLGREKVTLDLTDEHYEKLESFLRPFLAAGAKIPVAAEKKPDTAAARQRGAAMRAFANQYGLEYKEYTRKNGGSGGFKYSAELEEAFAAYEATGKVPRSKAS